MKTRTFARLFRLLPYAAIVSVLVGPRSSFAQGSGEIHGTVSDAKSNAPLSAAHVSIALPDRSATTDDSGHYTLPGLRPGSYLVTVSAIGRKPDTATVSVSSVAPTAHDVALAEGSLLLSSVIVSATRNPTEAGKVASTVNVLTPQQVRQSPTREAEDMLREIPAVELPRTSSLVGGTAQIVSMRGVDEGRTAVLFDGVPVNDAWGEWIDWGRVPKAMLDRVEVVEGGTSSLYGNGAMGGLIAFFSRPTNPGSGMLQMDAGSRNAQHTYAEYGIPLGSGFSANVSGDYQANGGYVLTDPARRGPVDVASQVIQRNSYLRMGYAPSSSFSTYLSGHLFGDSRGLGTPLSFANRDQRNIDGGLDYSGLAGGALQLRAWDGRQIETQRASNIRSLTLRNAEDSSLTAKIPSHDWGASAQWTRSAIPALESFSLGADFRHFQGDFNEVDFNTTCPGATCGSVVRTVSSGGEQTLGGAYAEAIATPITPLRVELSARVDHWNNDNGHSVDAAAGNTAYPNKTKNAFSPRLGVRYELTPAFSLRGAAYKAFRAPNLAELYRKQISATQITAPNPDLSAETAFGREGGFDWQPIGWMQLKGTYYVADYNNFNVPVTVTTNKPDACGTAATCRQRLNINKSRSRGGEAYLAVRPIPALMLSASATYDDARQQSGLPAGTENDHKPHINRVPSPKQTVRATWSSAILGEWTAIWRREGRSTTLGGIGLDPYSVIDANVERELSRGFLAFLSLENIGDVKYQINISGVGTAANPFIIFQGLPRTLRIGLEARKF